MSETIARLQAKRAALAGMQGGQPVDHDPDTAARLAAIEQRRAVLQDEMSRSGSEWGDDYAHQRPAPARQAPAQAGLPAMMPARATSPEMRTQTPSPSATGAPPIPSPVGMPPHVVQVPCHWCQIDPARFPPLSRNSPHLSSVANISCEKHLTSVRRPH